MPTVLDVNGYRFKFFSNENDEPQHIHITKGDGNSKYWLVPKCEEAYSYGFTAQERKAIKGLVIKHQEFLIKKWNEYFK
ncbi:MAG: DUF4160 domain-containing protein [Chitinophagales bacterium]|nr:DUF4160 domain-containing protein [Chitinophagales bacterium]